MAKDEVDVSDLSDIEVRWKSEAKGAVFRTLTDSLAMYSGMPAISPAPDGGGGGGRRGAWLNILLRVAGSTTGTPSITENNVIYSIKNT